MGLDMYLFKKQKAPVLKNEWVSVSEKPIEVIRWRKANMIRRWFADHTGYAPEGNCVWHKVSKEQLEDLLDTCVVVSRHHERAAELLPTSSGFFFGSMEYDESYFMDIERTIKELRTVLTDTDFDAYDVYYYEWW